MVMDHSDSERGNPQTRYHIPRPLLHVVEHWLEREIAQWVNIKRRQHCIVDRPLGIETSFLLANEVMKSAYKRSLAAYRKE